MPRIRSRRIFSALCSGALLAGALSLATGAAAAEDTAQPDAAARMAALMERMTVEQRQAVEEFRTWIARRGESRLTATLADGRGVAKLGGEGLQAMVTRKNADGTFTTRCVENPEEYAHFLLGDLDGVAVSGANEAAE